MKLPLVKHFSLKNDSKLGENVVNIFFPFFCKLLRRVFYSKKVKPVLLVHSFPRFFVLPFLCFRLVLVFHLSEFINPVIPSQNGDCDFYFGALAGVTSLIFYFAGTRGPQGGEGSEVGKGFT